MSYHFPPLPTAPAQYPAESAARYIPPRMQLTQAQKAGNTR